MLFNDSSLPCLIRAFDCREEDTTGFCGAIKVSLTTSAELLALCCSLELLLLSPEKKLRWVPKPVTSTTSWFLLLIFYDYLLSILPNSTE